MQLRCMDMKAVIQILMGKLERQRWIKTVPKKWQKADLQTVEKREKEISW